MDGPNIYEAHLHSVDKLVVRHGYRGSKEE